MNALPADIAAALARGVGAYIHAVPRHELPNALRPLQAFRPRALAARRGVLLDALDDDTFRNDVLMWLDEVKPELPPEDAALLRVACERPDGWEEQLAALSEGEDAPRAGRQDTGEVDALERAVEREREKTRRARADARRVRANLTEEIDALHRKVAALERDLDRTRAEAVAAHSDLEAAETRRAQAEASRDREVRVAARAAERAKEARERAGRELKIARREASAARRDVEAAERRIDDLEAEVARAREVRTQEEGRDILPRERKPLPVPKGRFDDDPQTLDGWLSTDRVTLLVDGYNVTKAEGGFGTLELEAQRDRLVAEVMPLVQRKNVPTTIVFDGSEVDAAARRPLKGPVKVEYSVAGENADDHLVALLERLPPDPVVVVTNDRELQERLRAHGATVATSHQLLQLIR